MDNNLASFHQTSHQKKESDKNKSTTKASSIQKHGTALRNFSKNNKDSFVESCRENTSRKTNKKALSDIVELLQKGICFFFNKYLLKNYYEKYKNCYENRL